MKKIFYLFNIIFISFLVVACGDSSDSVTSVNILLESSEVESLDAMVGDKINLSSKLNDDLNAAVTWESSNTSVATVDAFGSVDVLTKGNVVISVYVTAKPYISDSVIINCKNKVVQTGVGTGTKDNPIFLGNEGEDEPLEITFLEMSHIYGDALFIKKGNVEILIDSGYAIDGLNVAKYIEQNCTDNVLDLLVLSHSDGDHVEGLANALKNISDISLMVDYGGTASGTIHNVRTTYAKQYHSAYDCVNSIDGATDTYYLTKDLYFEVLNTGQYITKDKSSAGNASSVALIFYYKNFSFFTAGDITSSTESSLLKNEDLPEVTLYKASHHGSHGSNSQDFMNTLNPKYVGISAARAGDYQDKTQILDPTKTYNLNGEKGHPAAAAIERIYKIPNIAQNLNVYWNGANGTMTFTTYGKNDCTFKGSETTRGYHDLTLTNGAGVWDESIGNFKNKVTGEENSKLHETKVFVFRDYVQYLPSWALKEFYPEQAK